MPAPELAACGTPSAYRRHLRHKEDCKTCKTKHAERTKAQRRARALRFAGRGHTPRGVKEFIATLDVPYAIDANPTRFSVKVGRNVIAKWTRTDHAAEWQRIDTTTTTKKGTPS
jgi:hypothetical protein